MKRTFDLLNMRQSGNGNIAQLFGRAHSHAWDFERDVEWTHPLKAGEALVADGWAAYSRTPTYAALSDEVRARFGRRALSWTLSSLRLGESVALEVCLFVAQKSRLADHRNHAVHGQPRPNLRPIRGRDASRRRFDKAPAPACDGRFVPAEAATCSFARWNASRCKDRRNSSSDCNFANQAG